MPESEAAWAWAWAWAWLPARAPECGRGRRSRGRRSCRCRSCRCRVVRGVEHVLAGDAPTGAAALDGGDVEPPLGHEAAHDRRGQRGVALAVGGGRRVVGRHGLRLRSRRRVGAERDRGWRDRLGRGRRGRRFGCRLRHGLRCRLRRRLRRRFRLRLRLGRRCLGCRGSRRRAGRVAHHREAGADLHRLALRHEDLGDHARRGRRHLRVDLVGRDLEQRLVGIDVLADLLQPARDGAFRDRLPELGHRHVHCVLLGWGV